MRKNELSNWNFGDVFPSIEIDGDYWQKLTALEKAMYVKNQLFQEKDFGNRLNLFNFILSNGAKVGRSVIKHPEAREYFDILENSVGLISVLAAVGNIAKVKQSPKSTKNNDIAKLMGFPNGNYINETKLDLTSAMADVFADINDFYKNKYNLTIDNLNVDDGSKDQKTDQLQSFQSKTLKATGTVDGDKWGLIIKSSGTMFDDEDSTGTCTTRLYYPMSGMKMHPDKLKETIQKIIYQLYIDKVDTSKHFIKIKGTKLEICKRKEIDINITNIDVPKIHKAMRKVLTEKSRRGFALIGEPGVGKTICVHKLTNYFRDTIVFWVSPDSINTTTGIRNVFKIFKMFNGSIIVFDDLDSGPFTAKDEVLGEFIAHLDGTNNNDLSGVIIGTVNDPSKLHSSLLNRPERIDDVIHVQNPQTEIEIANIIFAKAVKKGYVPLNDTNVIMMEEDSNFDEEFDEEFDEDEEDMEIEEDSILDDEADIIAHSTGIIKFDIDDPKFLAICSEILKAKFTQAQVAGLVNDCHFYADNNEITVELLEERMNARLESINNSNKISKKGRLILDEENLSDEAYGMLGKRNRNISMGAI